MISFFVEQIHRNSLQDLMLDCRKTMEVHFIKKDGTPRIVRGVVEPHKNHPGMNPVAHKGQYVTITENWESERPFFKNASLATISKVKIGWTTYEVYGTLNNIFL